MVKKIMNNKNDWILEEEEDGTEIHVPKCCEERMNCIKNGISLIPDNIKSIKFQPKTLTIKTSRGDLYQCSKCSKLTVAGFEVYIKKIEGKNNY